MDDNYLRARLDRFAEEGHYMAVLDLAGMSKRHALGFRHGERVLSPGKRERLVSVIRRLDSGEVRFERHRERSAKTGKMLGGIAKTYAVPVDRAVETNFQLRYANDLFASLKAKTHGHPHLSLQTLRPRSRLP